MATDRRTRRHRRSDLRPERRRRHLRAATVSSGSLPSGALLADLLHRSGQGSTAAFAELYDATSSRIYTLIRRYANEPEASALTQRAYVELWHRAGDYAPGLGHPLTWILVTGLHSVLQEADPQLRSRLGAEPGVARQRRQPGRAELETRRLAPGPLARLQQEAVVLVHLGRYSPQEVGQLLDLPSGLVLTGVRDGLRRLTAKVPAVS